MSRPNGRKAFLSILMVLTLVFSPLVVQPVGAVQPQIETFHREGTDIPAECDGFVVIGDFVDDTRVITFFDNEGNPVGAQVHGRSSGTITNSLTGKSLPYLEDFTLFLDFEEGTLAGTGLVWLSTVPGEGPALLDAGKVVFDADFNVVFQAGPHAFIAEGSDVFSVALCQALD